MTTQTKNSVADQIAEIISNQIQCPKEQIVPNAEFVSDLGFDSLEQVEFIMAAEEAFNIEIPDEDAEQIKTVQQAISKIEQAIQKQGER